MLTRLLKTTLILLAVSALAACSLPTFPTASAPSPTPNQTMTALFSTPLATQAVESTSTLPSVITATPLATATLPAATNAAQPPTAVPPTAVPPTAVPPTPVPPTRTPLPPTATPNISQRAGVSVVASTMSYPTLDGGWTDFPVHDYAIPYVVYGKGNWSGSDDLAASYRIGWDKTNLYIAVKVHDDVYAQNASGDQLFKGDSLELLLDTNVSGDFYDTQTDSDDYQLGISDGRPDVNGTHDVYLWQPANVAGARSQVKVASTRNESAKLTRVEVIIPWSLFGVTPRSGMHLGFALSVSDNDNTTQNIQQILLSTALNRGLYDPTTWGDLVLK